jgi:hypothetical protein
MKINIAVPENDYFKRLYDNKDFIKENDINILQLNDEQSLELLIDSRIDAALLTPLAYGKAVGKCDLRIMPNFLCMAENFTDTVSIYFKDNLKEIKTISFSSKEKYLNTAAQILMNEKYDIFPEIIEGSYNTENFNSDIHVSWDNNPEKKNKINLSEEWFDNFYFPIPLLIWVCKAEDSPENIMDIVRQLFKSDDKIDEFFIQSPFHDDFYTQEGKIYWEWDNEFKTVLENTIQILFYHQLFPELPEVKFYEGT